MSSDLPRDVVSIQTELNRQALVEIGKRLTDLEHKIVVLDRSGQDLKFLTNNSLETVKRLQKTVKKVVAKYGPEVASD
jgi:archaellum component FlaC